MSDAETDGKAPLPTTSDYGYSFHLSMEDAISDAEANAGRVVVYGGSNEVSRWVTCWLAQPLARFLTRGGQVVWQGQGMKGHWDG